MGATPTGRPPGNPAKPIARQRKLGNPGRRPLPEPLHFERREHAPEPTRPLGSTGMVLWERCWLAGPWIDTAADLEAVLVLCEQADERAQLRARVIRDGDWRERSGLRALDAQIAANLSALGFTPSDRARMGVDTSGADLDDLEAFRARRRRDASA